MQQKRLFVCLRSSVPFLLPSCMCSSGTEFCIRVSRNDEYIGKISKADAHSWKVISNGEALHRAFSVFSFNSRNQLLLQQRASGKLTFPGLWTNACCSHPLHCSEELETKPLAVGVRRAAIRKLAQELGVDGVDQDSLRFVKRIIYKAKWDETYGEHELDYILFLRQNLKLRPNPAEVEQIRYVSREGLRTLMENDKEYHFSPWFILIARHFLFQWWGQLECNKLAADDTIDYFD